jgi:hypothetical protein
LDFHQFEGFFDGFDNTDRATIDIVTKLHSGLIN